MNLDTDCETMPQLSVQGLKHTFRPRQRAPAVSFKDPQDLLGLKSSRITTHYSALPAGQLDRRNQGGLQPQLVQIGYSRHAEKEQPAWARLQPIEFIYLCWLPDLLFNPGLLRSYTVLPRACARALYQSTKFLGGWTCSASGLRSSAIDPVGQVGLHTPQPIHLSSTTL
jgi:hypothetical protein